MNLPPKKASAPASAVTHETHLENTSNSIREESIRLRGVARERLATLEATARDTEIAMGKVLLWRH